MCERNQNFVISSLSLPSTVHLCNSGDRRVVPPLAPPPIGGGLWFVELVSGHDLHGGRVASWLGQPPVHGGPLSSRASDSFVLVWVGKPDGLVASWSWRWFWS
ncbi:hypothetical protein F2Q69_00051208 [Brassica cretica]|uniref:Uncharacterized protein n=1 Tax=Brassica cretica TaxID=69181 RepID=A0A8S9PXR6_BRACR|nr:hypothetical protein F2Q69_00051208 [Brassica cretica]